jgi:hypothetical protein
MNARYQEYLESPHWKKTRGRKRSRVRACGICGSTSGLDVHHLNYRQLLDVGMSDLRVLCRLCHTLAHVLYARGVFRFSSTNHLHRWELLKNAVKAHFREGHPRPEWRGVVTQKWLLWHATENGGWTRRQLDALGVSWPPAKGWLSKAIGQPLSEPHRAAFEAGRE